MSFHRELGDGNIHVIFDQTYATTTARDADTAWNGLTENIGKVVKVTAGPVFFILGSIAPTWLEITTSVSQSLAGALAIGNTTGGSDIVVQTGDKITLTDAPSLGPDAANKDYVDAQVSAQDTLAEILAIGNQTGGTDIVVDTGDKITLTDAPALDLDAANKLYVDGRIAEFDEFIELEDTPLTYNGQAGKVLQIKSLEDGVEFSDAPSIQSLTVSESLTLTDGAIIYPDKSTLASGIEATSYQYNLSTIQYVQSQLITEEGSSLGISFKPDGSKMYILGTLGDALYEFNLSTPWDISTESFVQSFSITSIDNGPRQMYFKWDGSAVYITGNQHDSLYHFTLSTPWDVSSMSLTDTMVVTEDGFPNGVWFRPDGGKLYIVGNVGEEINEYDLSIPWDISTETFNQSLNVPGLDPQGLAFSPDGSKMYFTDTTGDKTYQYALTTPWDISTATLDFTYNTLTDGVRPFGIYINNTGTKFYSVGVAPSTVHEYNMWLSADGRNAPTIAENVVEVYRQEDFGVLTVGFGIAVTPNTTFKIMAPIIQTEQCLLTTGSKFEIIVEGRKQNLLTYTNTTEAQFQGTNISFSIINLNLQGNETGVLFDLTGGGLSLKFCDIERYLNAGTLDGVVDFFCIGGFWDMISGGVAMVDCASSTIQSNLILGLEGNTFSFFNVSGASSGDLQIFENIMENDAFSSFIHIASSYPSGKTINISGNNVVSGLNFWGSGSLDQTDVKVIARGNKGTPDSATNTDLGALDEGGTQTLLNQNAVKRMVGTFITVAEERFQSSAGGNVIYKGVDDATINHISVITGTVSTGTNINMNFYIVKGNINESIISFTDVFGGETLVTTNVPHGYSNGDRIVIESTVGYDGEYSITDVTSLTFTISEEFTATETGSMAKVQTATKASNQFSGANGSTTMIAQIAVKTDDFLFVGVENTDSAAEWNLEDIHEIYTKV